jgi:hypothetical protein
MSVLAAFYKVARNNVLFRDPDFFISYFKRFMFDDLQFAECILRPNRVLTTFRDEVHGYLKNRLYQFFTMDHDDWAEKLNQCFRSGQRQDAMTMTDDSKSEFVSPEFFTIANSVHQAERGRILLNTSVRVLLEATDALRTAQRPKGLTISPIRHLFAHVIATRSFLRIASRNVWVVNFENGVGLAETEAAYRSLLAREGGECVTTPIKDQVPNGPAILESVALGRMPYFVLRAIEKDKPGPVLAIFGHMLAAKPPVAPVWSPAKTSEYVSPSDSILTPGKGGKFAQDIKEIRNIWTRSKLDICKIYQAPMMFHHLHNCDLTSEFLDKGFKGVLGDRSYVKALAALSIMSNFAIPTHLWLSNQRNLWSALMSSGEISIDYDTTIATLTERGSNAGWKMFAPVSPDFVLVLPC